MAGNTRLRNQAVRSPLTLTSDGVWLTVDTNIQCPLLTTPGGTARALFGAANLYFEDPHSPVGQQPFSGYAVVAAMPAAGSCLLFRMTALSDQSREAILATFMAIVQQAQHVG